MLDETRIFGTRALIDPKKFEMICKIEKTGFEHIAFANGCCFRKKKLKLPKAKITGCEQNTFRLIGEENVKEKNRHNIPSSDALNLETCVFGCFTRIVVFTKLFVID